MHHVSLNSLLRWIYISVHPWCVVLSHIKHCEFTYIVLKLLPKEACPVHSFMYKAEYNL